MYVCFAIVMLIMYTYIAMYNTHKCLDEVHMACDNLFQEMI